MVCGFEVFFFPNAFSLVKYISTDGQIPVSPCQLTILFHLEYLLCKLVLLLLKSHNIKIIIHFNILIKAADNCFALQTTSMKTKRLF